MKVDRIIDNYKDAIINDLRDLVRMKTVYSDADKNYPFGKENNDSLEYMLEKCEKEGMVTKNLDGYGGYADLGDEEKTIGIFTHLDVVPAGNGWNSEPFDLKIEDGKLIGRGVSDDKGPVIAAFYAIKALRESGIKINNRIRLFFGLDEETNLRCIERYNKTEKAPDVTLVPDADFPVTNYEKGLINFDIKKTVNSDVHSIKLESLEGGQKRGMVPDSCYVKIRATTEEIGQIISKVEDFNLDSEDKVETVIVSKGALELKTKGISAHASVPEVGKNAVSTMFKFLKRIDLGVDANKYVSFYNENIGKETDGKSLNLKTCDKTGELTLNVGVAKYKDGAINLEYTIRYPESLTEDMIIEKLKNITSKYDCDLHNIKVILPTNIPEDSEFVKALTNAYTEFTGDELRPASIGFRTYASKLPNALGFGPNFTGEEKVAHQSNEYITIDNLMKNVKLMARAICKLDKQLSKDKNKDVTITDMSLLNALVNKGRSKLPTNSIKI